MRFTRVLIVAMELGLQIIGIFLDLSWFSGHQKAAREEILKEGIFYINLCNS